MIGIYCNTNEVAVVEEFFQLFKTPWEYCKKDHSYDVVLTTQDVFPLTNSNLIIIYGSERKKFESKRDIAIKSRLTNAFIVHNGSEVPIYGKLSTFKTNGQRLLDVKGSREIAGIKIVSKEGCILRAGFNLFEEVLFLLSKGQPKENAHIPTLELHIAILRNWVLEARIPVIEIPPVPAGYEFIVCLTHDVDFIKIQQHKLNHTLWGFLYRALFASFYRVFQRKTSLRVIFKNFNAVLSLPFIYLGLVKDFWFQFEKYMEIEEGVKSTFFLIPFRNRMGEKVFMSHPERRATRYDISDIPDQVKKLMDNGFGIGVHGIDAWHSLEMARSEFNRIFKYIRKPQIGIRMHWLCLQDNSFKILEEAGYFYDSTFGYNETIGYRGGTTQVFRPIGVKNILELPMHIQDTAIFYPHRMNLSESNAWKFCEKLINNAQTHGGVLTTNWHHRSLGPERLWGQFYVKLLAELKRRRVWFGNAEQVVNWFRKRRDITFDEINLIGKILRLRLGSYPSDIKAPFIIRIHIPISVGLESNNSRYLKQKLIDIPWKGERELEISL